MKMYILVKEDIPLGIAMTAVAHASAAAMQKWKNDLDFITWLETSFKKVVCKVNQKEFEAAKQFKDHIVMTEKLLDGVETAIVFLPRYNEEWPKPFKFYRLYK